jgi:cytochrome c-type biogenesis protein CcmH/NrfG
MQCSELEPSPDRVVRLNFCRFCNHRIGVSDGEKKKAVSGYVKTETMLVVMLIALGVGFLGGVTLAVYKSSAKNMPAAGMSQDPDRRQMAQALEDEVQQRPDNEGAWVQLGHIYFDQNQHAEAIRAYEKALELNPNNADILTDVGVMYRRDGQPRKAVEAFDKAAALDPKHEPSRFNKGIVLMHDLKDQPGAVAAWKDLLAVNPLAQAPNGQTVDELVQHYETHADQ